MKKSNEDKKRLMRAIFKHINTLPYYEIQQSVILVSFTEEHAYAFKKITGIERQANEKHPFLFPLKDGTRLIDPTATFLRPQTDINFVTMHYIMNLVEKAKFIFIFNAGDTQAMPYTNIKTTLIRFISMFRQFSKDQIKKLIKSCGIMITEAKKQFQADIYSDRLSNGMLQQGFLAKDYQNVKLLVSGILQSKNILLSCAGQPKTLITKQFTDFVSKISLFQLQDQVDLRLESTYKDFCCCKIHEIWQQMFKNLYNYLDTIIINKQKQLSYEIQIYRQIRDYDKKNRDNEQVSEPKNIFKSIKLLKVIYTMIKIKETFDQKGNNNIDTFQNKKNEQVLASFLTFLYSSHFLMNEFIKQFLMCYFLIRKFLSKKNKEMDDLEADLFHRISFIDSINNTDTFNSKLRVISLQVLKELQADLTGNIKAYPFEQCLSLLNSILEHRDNPNFTFFTDRIRKKLLKYRANVAYKLIKLSKKDKKSYLRNELNFIKWSSQSKLINDKDKIEVLINIALELAEHEQTVGLSLQIFKILPEYEVYKHVRYIYEKSLQLNPQTLQYLTPQKRKQQLSSYFENYYTFLLRIGFQQSVRELTMECLRLADSVQEREFFKNALVRARGNSFRDMHNQFLEESILKEKEVNISDNFLKYIEDEMMRNQLIEKK